MNPNQPRVPKGSPDGGQFAGGNASPGAYSKGALDRFKATVKVASKRNLAAKEAKREANREAVHAKLADKLNAAAGIAPGTHEAAYKAKLENAFPAQKAMRAADSLARSFASKVEAGTATKADRQRMVNITAKARNASGARYVPSSASIKPKGGK